MYPRISDLFLDLFGIDLPLPLYSFGLMVAIALITATWLTRLELDRMYARGLVGPVRARIKDDKGREKVAMTSPSALVWTMMLLAGGFGVAGSKLFHIIDNWDLFMRNPAAMIFSGSGLTIYGGLICAGIAIALYARKKGIHVGRLSDAIAPGLMLAYGIGRIGCYLSGDGDWGVCSSLADKPAWLPGLLWSETFPRNMVGMDPVAFNLQVRNAECTLAAPDGVYPTMLYEFAMAAVLAGVLWLVRKHPFKAGWLISLYAVFAGLERLLIEQIRVNPQTVGDYAQAEVISVVFIIAGLVGLALLTRRMTETPVPPAAAPQPAAA